MSRCVIDVEGDGLLDTITKLWCAVAFDIDNHQWHRFILKDGDYDPFKQFLDNVDVFIGHHILGYDLDAISLICDYQYQGDICDTLLYSRLPDPDRKLPDGCPTHTPDPITGKKKLVGAHGLEAWGFRECNEKPYIDRWTEWHPKILTRCETDVKINYLMLLSTMREMGLTELVSVPYKFGHKWSR